MKISQISVNTTGITLVSSDVVCIVDGQSALDFIMTINYDTGNHAIVINKEAIAEDFFILRTKIAGDIVQKLVNYRFRLAIVGDYSGYTSTALKDFMVESNRGRTLYFVSTTEEAIEKLKSMQ